MSRVCPVCGHRLGPIPDELWSAALRKHDLSAEHRAAAARRGTVRFFVPGLAESDAEAFYHGIVALMTNPAGSDVADRRIFSLAYRHQGTEYYVEVGKPDPRVAEVVLAILESRCYLVCTFTRGATPGSSPVLVGRDEVMLVTEFAP